MCASVYLRHDGYNRWSLILVWVFSQRSRLSLVCFCACVYPNGENPGSIINIRRKTNPRYLKEKIIKENEYNNMILYILTLLKYFLQAKPVAININK